MEKKDFILASASPYRLALLEQVALCPKLVCPADIDESCLRFETPSRYVKRMALEKARRVAALHPGENVLACDTSAAGFCTKPAATRNRRGLCVWFRGAPAMCFPPSV